VWQPDGDHHDTGSRQAGRNPTPSWLNEAAERLVALVDELSDDEAAIPWSHPHSDRIAQLYDT
jgi:hypothetical protein